MTAKTSRLFSLVGLLNFLFWSLFWTGIMASQATAQCVAGPHSGAITANQIWCAADNPHLLDNEVTVAVGVTLTIEPGAIIQGTTIYTGMTILGELQALGTVGQPILFTSQADTGPEQWRGLGFEGGLAKGHLRQVIVRSGGMYHALPNGTSPAEVFAYNVGAGKLQIEDSLITRAAGSTSGGTWGVEVYNSHFVMTGTTISGLGAASDDRAMRIWGTSTATVSNNTFTGNPGTTLIVGGEAVATISQNDFYGNWLAMSIAGDAVLVEKNQIHDNGFNLDPKGGIRITGGSPTISRNIFRNNTSNSEGAIGIGGGRPSLINNVIVGNHAQYRCSAISIGTGSPIFKHTTISGNDGGDGSAICALTGQFYNTIIANEGVGVNIPISTGSVQMVNTLWDNVLVRFVGDGTLQETASISGKALFDADGYHLTRYSNAIGWGTNAGVTTDIDSELRPQPLGTLPDLGADEYIYDQAPNFWIEFYAEDPKLEARENGGARIEQQYYVFWNYGSEESSPADLPLTIQATISSQANYLSQETTGSVGYGFQQGAETLTWDAQAPVQKNQSGYVGYTVYYSPSVQPGTTVTSTVQVTAGATPYSKLTQVQIPFFPPKILYPTPGESCAGLDVVSGYSIPGSRIKLLEDGLEVTLLTQAFADAQGVFSITYNSTKAGINDSTSITVLSCNASDPSQCSPPSNGVTVNRSTSFWCPKSSYWEGDFQTVHGGTQNFHGRFKFRDNSGKLVTDNWIFSAGTGLVNSKLSLTMCPCPGSIEYPSAVTVYVNGNVYFSVGDKIKTFTIPAASGAVEFRGICPSGLVVNHGTILVDPDGYIFDVTQGFDPNNPNQHTLADATVTLMVDEPELGGWVQWPAHLFNQVNPQVTGPDGYYAFYTPPGNYYVKVSNRTGFQFWRSPVVTVTNKLVHLNVPLTPISNQSIRSVNLTVSGPDKPIVYVPAGGTVEWLTEMIPNISTESRRLYTENPIIRLLSDLDPLTSTMGWDGGMSAPGQIFQRRFDQNGVYFYSDGLGHIGKVYVGHLKLYLPLILK
jgi:hypothetical protein